MVTSYKTQAGIRWRVAIRSSRFGNHFKSGFVKEKDANDYSTVVLSRMIRGTFAPDEGRNYGTLSDALKLYQADIPVDEPFRQVKICRIKRWLKTTLAREPISKLKKVDFRDWRNARQKELKPDGRRQISDKSLYKELVVVIGLWSHATREWDWRLGECPAKLDTDSGKRRKRNKAEQEKPRITPKTQAIITAIFASRGHNPYLEPIFNFAIETSIRAFELIQLRWQDVHWDDGVIFVPSLVSKNGASRWVSLSDEALQILRRTPRDIVEPRIFPLSRPALSSAWARAKRRVDFPAGITFHSARHEALTRFAEAGLSINQLLEQGGHKTLSMLLVYLGKSNAKETRAKIVAAKQAQRAATLIGNGTQLPERSQP